VTSITHPLLLAIESSGTTGSVALLTPHQMPASLTFTSATLHSQRLMPSIDWLFERTGLAPGDLDAVAVARGPGSFTGLRIGMSVAKAVAYAAGATILGISTLHALALRVAGAAPAGMPVCALLDARQGQVYALLARALLPVDIATEQPSLHLASPTLEVLHDEFAGSVEEVCGWIDAPTLFAGDGAVHLSELLRDRLGSRFLLAPPVRLMLSAEEVGILAMQRLALGDTDNLAALEPEYLRQSYTEAKKPRP
jgi:tRNA threonylcarbamoyladenosine biosynthesis protein TsaB